MNINNLRRITGGRILKDEPMSRHTTFRTGGKADCYIIPKNIKELAGLIRYFELNGIAYFVIGNGSNILVSDEGIRGAVIDIGRNDDTEFSMLGYEWQGEELHMDVGAGCLLSAVGRIAANLEASGFEALSGIPGCIGGACIMNAGAYGSEIKDVVRSIDAVSKKGESIRLEAEKISFSYRGSSLMDDGLIVARAEIVLKKGSKKDIEAKMEELAAQRKEKQPLEYPSAGSTFKRPCGNFAGKLISDAGLKGLSIGGACVSEKHAGFIINKGGASSHDIYMLIKRVQQEVQEGYGILLEPEVKLIGKFE